VSKSRFFGFFWQHFTPICIFVLFLFICNGSGQSLSHGSPAFAPGFPRISPHSP